MIPSTPLTKQEILRAHDTGDFCDLIWANAALPRVTGLSQAEPEDGLAPPGFDPISQEGDNQ